MCVCVCVFHRSILDQCLFMNNYGIRTIDEKSGFGAEETHRFCRLILEMHHFAKTGSGQTWGKHPKRETCVYYIAGVWNWNAPMWLGVNTINVNGKTTTLIGSCLWYGKRVFSDAILY